VYLYTYPVSSFEISGGVIKVKPWVGMKVGVKPASI
jgi:hypothetical protein